MNPEQLIHERDKLRIKWRDARTERLNLKNTLISLGKTVIEVRHNKHYIKLKKEQRHLSRMIKHIENKISREIKNEA